VGTWSARSPRWERRGSTALALSPDPRLDSFFQRQRPQTSLGVAGYVFHLVQTIVIGVFTVKPRRASGDDFAIDMQIGGPHLHHEPTIWIVIDAQHHNVLAFKRRGQHRLRLAAERLVRFRRVDIRQPEIHDNALDLRLEGIAVGDADDMTVENFIVPWRRSLLVASRCAFLRRWLSMTVPLAGSFMEVTAVFVYAASVTECVRVKQESDDKQRRNNRK